MEKIELSPEDIISKKTNKITELYDAYSELLSYTLAENKHLYLPSFHNFLSHFINSEFMQGGESYMLTPIHEFMLQTSGTGKGVMQGFNEKLLIYCGCKSAIANEFTTAGIIGGITWNDKGEMVQINKPLEEYGWLGVDEGSFFMGNANQHVMGFIKAINRYLDCGKIRKMLRGGELSYEGNAILSMGSFVDNTVKGTFLGTGFFQRFWITFKDFNSKEIDELNSKQIRLSTIAKKQNKRIEELKDIIKNIVEEIKGKKEIKGKIGKIFCVTQEATPGFKRDYALDDETTEYYANKFDVLKQKLRDEDPDTFNCKDFNAKFMTCLSRTIKLGYKIMTHYATVNQEESITKEAIDYALIGMEMHMISFKEMIINAFSNDEKKGENKMKVKKGEAHACIMYLAKNKETFTRADIINKVKIGYGLCDKMLDTFVNNQILTMTRGENNSKIYRLVK